MIAWSSELFCLLRGKKLAAGKAKSSRFAPAKRELERESVPAKVGRLPFATAHAAGRAASTFVTLGKKPFGVLI